jgi:hypothetical protein
MWRGTVASAIRGKRGQAFLREMLTALDAMPEKRLIAHDLQSPAFVPPEHGGVCAIGSVGVARSVDMTTLDVENYDAIAATFGIAAPLVQEIEFMNDDAWGCYRETPEEKWTRMRAWVAAQIRA